MVGVLRRALASRSPKSRAPLFSNTVTRPCPSTQLQLRFTFPSPKLANIQGWRDEGAYPRSEMGSAEEQELQIPSRSRLAATFCRIYGWDGQAAKCRQIRSLLTLGLYNIQPSYS
jgi:hypothetical protein